MRMLHAHAWRAGVPPEIPESWRSAKPPPETKFRLPSCLRVLPRDVGSIANKRQTAPTPCGVSCTWPAECGIGTRLSHNGNGGAGRDAARPAICGQRQHRAQTPGCAHAGASGRRIPCPPKCGIPEGIPRLPGTPLWEQPGSRRQRTGECRPFRYSDRRMLPEWNGWRPKTGPLRRQSCARRRRSQVRLPAQIPIRPANLHQAGNHRP